MNTVLIGKFLTALIIAAIILAIAFIFWTIVWIPIKKKEMLDETKQEEQRELNKILAAKGSEWENYQRLVNTNSKLKSENIDQNNKNSDLEKKNAELIVANGELKAINSQLKKENAARIKNS